jgi:hypothetical protein
MHKGADNFAVLLATKPPSETAIASSDNRQARATSARPLCVSHRRLAVPSAKRAQGGAISFPEEQQSNQKRTRMTPQEHGIATVVRAGYTFLNHVYPQLMDYYRDVKRQCDDGYPTAQLLAYALGNLTDAFAGGFQAIGAWQTYWLLLSNFDGYESSCW